MLDLLLWLLLILVLFWGVTQLIKRRLPQSQTWHILSMVKFTKPLKIFDAFQKHPRLVNGLTDLGLVIGFGAVAVDFLWLRTRPLWQRVLGFGLSVVVLGALTNLVFPTNNPIVPVPPLVLETAFGIFGIAGLVLVSLLFSGLDIITKLSSGKNACAGVAPVIPGVDLPNSPISVPLHAWISFAIILIVHEASHGFVVRKLGMKIKSYGLLLLGFLPIGAFVEPDENELKKLEKRDPREALRMYAAGPASNFYFFVIGGIVVALLGGLLLVPAFNAMVNPIYQQSVSGVQITSVEEKIIVCGTEFPTPAFGVLQEGDQILKVDGMEVHNLVDYRRAIAGKTQYTLTTLRAGAEEDHTFEPNELGRLGILVKDMPNPDFVQPSWYQPLLWVASTVGSFIGWLLILNFLVATANYIPIEPFDGGKMTKLLLLPYFGFLKLGEEETKKAIGRFFVAVMLVLILINAAPLVFVSSAV